MADVRHLTRPVRAALPILAGYEVRLCKTGWRIFIRGSKMCVGKLAPGAIGLSRALNAICDWQVARKKPRRRYRMSGSNKGWSVGGVRRSAAERREYFAQLAAETAAAMTRADPSINSTNDA